jgi:FkbM family methyltransferase
VNDSPVHQVDEEAVRIAVRRAGYRALLGREPESAAIDPATPPLFSADFDRSLADIVRTFADSAEFAQQRGKLWFAPDTWVQMLIDNRVRLWIDLGDAGVSRSCLTGGFEPVETEYVLGLIKAGMTFVDIGANIGWFAVQAADRVGAAGHVIAFEPRPTTSHWLKRSIEDNGFSARAEVHACAVGPNGGEISIGCTAGTDNPGGTWTIANETVEAHFRGGNSTVTRVPMVTLDEVVGDRRVDVIKIDIEGAEPLAMAGATRVLSEQRPIIVSEINPNALELVSNVSAREYLDRMTALGYRCRELIPGGLGGEYDGGAIPAGVDMINVAFLPER